MLKKIVVSAFTAGMLLSSANAMDPSGFYIGVGGDGLFIDDIEQYGGKVIGGKHVCDHGDLEIRLGGLNSDKDVKEAFTAEFYAKPVLQLEGEWSNTKLYGLAGVTYYDYKKNVLNNGDIIDFNGWTATAGLGASYVMGIQLEHELFVDWTFDFGNQPFGENNNNITIGYIYNF